MKAAALPSELTDGSVEQDGTCLMDFLRFSGLVVAELALEETGG